LASEKRGTLVSPQARIGPDLDKYVVFTNISYD